MPKNAKALTLEEMQAVLEDINENVFDEPLKVAKSKAKVMKTIADELEDDGEPVLRADDEVSEETWKTLIALEIAVPAEILEQYGPDVEDEDEDEDDEVEEKETKKSKKKGKDKKSKGKDKKSKKKKAPSYGRINAISAALKKIPKKGKTLDELADQAQEIYLDKTGKDADSVASGKAALSRTLRTLVDLELMELKGEKYVWTVER